jgi:hypothetical protein
MREQSAKKKSGGRHEDYQTRLDAGNAFATRLRYREQLDELRLLFWRHACSSALEDPAPVSGFAVIAARDCVFQTSSDPCCHRGQCQIRRKSGNATPFILGVLINNTFSVAFRADFPSHLCASPQSRRW